MTDKRILLLQLLTPMHVGGNYEFSVVDQPIQREGHTGFPKIEASSLKGSIRHHFAKNTDDSEKEKEVFGETDKAGDIIFTDSRILFFPIRSAKGVFALITCPSIIKRLNEDLKRVGSTVKYDNSFTRPVTADTTLHIADRQVLLDEYHYTNVEVSNSFKRWVTAIEDEHLSGASITPHAMLLSDDDFAYFVKNSTEIITRTAIDPETNTVVGSALFDEEYVPTEAIFYSSLFSQQKNIDKLALDVFQIGGNMTLGKGFVQSYLSKGSEL